MYGSEGKSNGLLDTPIGLITLDEVLMGGSGKQKNGDYYLYKSFSFATMTPKSIDGNGGDLFGVYGDGHVDVRAGYSLVPVINLKSTTMISSGNGTKENPYVVDIPSAS